MNVCIGTRLSCCQTACRWNELHAHLFTGFNEIHNVHELDACVLVSLCEWKIKNYTVNWFYAINGWTLRARYCSSFDTLKYIYPQTCSFSH